MMTIYELPATPLVAVCSDEQDNLQYSLVVLKLFFFIQKVYIYQSGCHYRIKPHMQLKVNGTAV